MSHTRALAGAVWAAGLGFVSLQCSLAANRVSVSDPAMSVGYVGFAVLFAILAIVGAYYIVVRSS